MKCVSLTYNSILTGTTNWGLLCCVFGPITVKMYR